MQSTVSGPIKPTSAQSSCIPDGCISLMAASYSHTTVPLLHHPSVNFIPAPTSTTATVLALTRLAPTSHICSLNYNSKQLLVRTTRACNVQKINISIGDSLLRRTIITTRTTNIDRRLAFVRNSLFRYSLQRTAIILVCLLPRLGLHLHPRLLDRLHPNDHVVSRRFSVSS